jgi:hypothetical protein
MREITGFIRAYSKEISKPVLFTCSLLIAVLIWLNYGEKLEYNLLHFNGLPVPEVLGRWLIFQVAFIVPYVPVLLKKKGLPRSFIACLVAAPLIFALKAGMDTGITIKADPAWNDYWNHVLYWPLRLLLIIILLGLVNLFINREPSFYGLVPQKKINPLPYIIMLLIMIPLIAVACTQTDFLSTYPKMKMVLPLPPSANPGWWYKLLFELSYGSDFISIELFFRGFLVIGFIKWVGKDAILPMACFYCTIHFGKPMGECISSFFGGLLLGIVSYHSRSIYGGLMVHLGIAWLMEAGGYIGNLFIK